MKFIKRLIFRTLGTERYLRTMQNGYFILYRTGLLRLSSDYDLHYYVHRLVHKGDTVIDIGANLGYYSVLFAEWVGPQGTVYSVEPVKVYNKVFDRKAAKYDNIVLLPYALGEDDKTIEMVTSTGGGYLRTGLPHVHDPQKDGPVEKAEFRFQARMKRPEELFSNLERIDYIKCDVEGYEFNILSRMKKILEKHKPKIQVEVWGENERNTNELLKSIGYTPHKLVEGKLEIQVHGGAPVNGDYIFIHKDDIRYKQEKAAAKNE